MSAPLAGRVALVTGAGAGIGRATALALARAGAEVAVWDLDGATAEAVAGEVGGIAIAGSVADSEQVPRGFARIDAWRNRLDILVNNAGISGNRPTLELEVADWRRTMSVNVDGVFFCAREAGRRMREAGGGAIVNVSSIYGIVAAPNRLSYCASKAAVAMMTRALAIEWAAYGIRVNAVAPGYVRTHLVEAIAAEGRIDLAALERRTPQGRLGTTEEIADAILYLCEPRAAHVTGQVLAVDGGWTAYGYV